MFNSFFWAGFECTYALPRDRKPLDLLASTKHDLLCAQDYKRLIKLGIKTVREGLSWSQIDQGGGVYHFTRFEKMMQIAQELGIQQIWDLNHFDYPKYLNPFYPMFVEKFALYAKEAVKVIRRYQTGTIYIVPWNEISFTAWMAADQGNWAPFTKGRRNGFRFKSQLVLATIAAMKAIQKEDADVRFIHVDPIMRRIPKTPDDKRSHRLAKEFNTIIRFEAWDMIAGKSHPELGGQPEYLDIIGVNYYFHNQMWIVSHAKPNSDLTIDWDDPARIPFRSMLAEVHDRYNRPMILSETGSYGHMREKWWPYILQEVEDARNSGLPLIGVCSYPTLDKPLEIPWLFVKSGLWDFALDDPSQNRIPHNPSLRSIKKFIAKHG